MSHQEIVTAYVLPSPLFEITTEDGPSSDFNLQIVAENKDGEKYTHHKTYHRFEGFNAQSLADKIDFRGEIDLQYWGYGTSWDHYATPQTRSEEELEHDWKGGR